MELLDVIHKGDSVLVVGKPRSEKTIFAAQFLADGLRQKEGSIYLITNNFPESAVDNIFRYAQDSMTELKIIDCYTLHAGVSKLNEESVLRVSGPYALNEISIAITTTLRKVKPPMRAVFDTISPMMLHNKLSEIEDFLEVNIGKLRSRKATTLVMVEKGMHDEKELSLLESLTDATIEFDSRVMTVKSSGEEKEIKYKLEENKIIMEA